MSILISGMKIPEDDCTVFRSVIVCNQWVDGEIKMYAHDFYTNEFIGEVINVPPHGRLIDADALKLEWKNRFVDTLLYDAPTIIEAEEG